VTNCPVDHEVATNVNGFYVTLEIASNATVASFSSKPVNPGDTNSMGGFDFRVSAVGGLVTSNSTPNLPADKYLAAIQGATDLRAGMIYLRPAASYLRSSFTASAALDDQGQVWHNMLEQQSWRATPIMPAVVNKMFPGKSGILSELDKESWQNINRVRVAGVGHVNYVLAKDDIGNWYVKSFSNDPTNLFGSMAGLAQYAAGGSLPMLAKGGLTNAASVASAVAGATGASQSNNVLAAEFNLVASNYLGASFSIYTNAFADAGKMNDDITNDTGWTAATNGEADVQSNAFKTFTMVLTNVAATVAGIDPSRATNGNLSFDYATTFNQQTTKILAAAGTYFTNVSKHLNLPMNADALNIVSNVITSYSANYISQQTGALDRCEVDINLISQMANGN
jgi:hypothetical protein